MVEGGGISSGPSLEVTSFQPLSHAPHSFNVLLTSDERTDGHVYWIEFNSCAGVETQHLSHGPVVLFTFITHLKRCYKFHGKSRIFRGTSPINKLKFRLNRKTIFHFTKILCSRGTSKYPTTQQTKVIFKKKRWLFHQSQLPLSKQHITFVSKQMFFSDNEKKLARRYVYYALILYYYYLIYACAYRPVHISIFHIFPWNSMCCYVSKKNIFFLVDRLIFLLLLQYCINHHTKNKLKTIFLAQPLTCLINLLKIMGKTL